MKNALRVLITTLVLSAASFAGVTISSPASGTTTTSPVHFVASASSTNPITAMRIYVDNVSVYLVSANKLDTLVTMASGTHSVVVQAWDSTGAVFKTPLTLSISGASATPTPTPTPAPGLPAPPSTAVVKGDIDQMTGWESCTVCAGANAAGPVAIYSMVENQASPSLDGRSAKFSISGSTPYSDALWWKQLGAADGATNLKYDLYFYITNPGVAQALEFDNNQSNGVHKFIYGTQCNIKGGHWDVWGNAAGNWISTGIACSVPTAFVWHHLTWEFQRTATNVIFVGFTYDGVTHYVNKSYPARSSSGHEMNVAFQMDGDFAMHAYSTWLDKISLTYW
ncbi:MAG TPA: Ig-like domain-containing protein [Candidatus Angelobacter sp.]|nr:Ig-like domain-containing protein [Candidatus Angelobacter sp.]